MPETDAKAGFCSNCRRGDHTLCMSPSCSCPDMRKHRNRPGFAGRDESQSASGTAPMRQAVPQNPPVQFVKSDGLVWCDPPSRSTARGGRIDYTALAAPCKERPQAWLRLKTYSSKSAAASARKKAAFQLGDGWELRAARIPEGSGLWVRWVGQS